jgi:hypothetical protein
VYAVRRIVAVLVILLLLVLLVPRACQALFGPEESVPGTPETTTTSENTTGGTEETTEQGSTAVSRLEEETETESSISRTTSNVQASREESSEALGVETAANLTGMVAGPEPVVGETSQIAPIPEIGTQQQVQPIPLEQPVTFEPIPLEEPIFLEEPTFFEEPSFFEEPVFSEEETASSAPTASGPVATINSGKAKDVVPATINAPPVAPPIQVNRPHVSRDAVRHNDPG